LEEDGVSVVLIDSGDSAFLCVEVVSLPNPVDLFHFGLLFQRYTTFKTEQFMTCFVSLLETETG
jgi:hypothetical protein